MLTGSIYLTRKLALPVGTYPFRPTFQENLVPYVAINKMGKMVTSIISHPTKKDTLSMIVLSTQIDKVSITEASRQLL